MPCPRLTPSKIKPLFVKFLVNGSEGLRTSVYVYMLQVGNTFVDEVRNALERKDAHDALKFLDEVESSNKQHS